MLAILIIIISGMVLSPAFMAGVGVGCVGCFYVFAKVFYVVCQIFEFVWGIAAAILGFFNTHVLLTLILVVALIYFFTKK